MENGRTGASALGAAVLFALGDEVQLPKGTEYVKLMTALSNLQGNASADVLREWIEHELAARDADNRMVGHENKHSEAHALATILKAFEKSAGDQGGL